MRRHGLRALAAAALVAVVTSAHAQPPPISPVPDADGAQPEPVPEPAPVPPPVPPPPPTPALPPQPMLPPPGPRCDMATCQHFGICPDAAGGCSASLTSCRRSLRCGMLGFCTPQDGQCAIGANEDCRRSNACRVHGLCAARGQTCVAEDPAHCLASQICDERGACSPRGGACVRDLDSPMSGEMKTRSVGLRNTGIGFTIAGPVLGLVGAGLLSERETVVAGIFMTPVGASLLMMGIPMWMLGAHEIPSDTEPLSMGAVVGGVVLAGLGLGGMGVGSVFFMATEDNTLPAIPMVLGGGMLIGGIAAGIYGIETTRIVDNTSLRIGPGSFEMSYKF